MFQVDWDQEALDQLSEKWMEADAKTRKEITKASHEIDQNLSADPYRVSESRPQGRRIAVFLPLVVRFRVSPKDKTVIILHVKVYKPRIK